MVTLVIALVVPKESICTNGIHANGINSVSTLSQNIIFDYNSTYVEKIYFLEFSNIELGEINYLELYFSIIGDSSDSNGLEISFVFSFTDVKFIIGQSIQDNLIHNLTQHFTYSGYLSETFSASIICSGKADINQSGSLLILDTTSIQSIDPPSINEKVAHMQAIPNWINFQGSLHEVKSARTVAYFNSFNLSRDLNITLSFDTNQFSALFKYVEIKLNNRTIVTKSFFSGKTNLLSFFIPSEEGLNCLSFNFSIEYSINRIEISKITIIARESTFEENLSEDVFTFTQWEGSGLDYVFNISRLKSSEDLSDQILRIFLGFKYNGTKFLFGINYEIISGTRIIYEGQISYFQQLGFSEGIIINAYTTTYHESLMMRIFGSAEGSGTFYLLNSSNVITKPIPVVSEQLIERMFLAEGNFSIPSIGYKLLNFYDVFRIDSSLASKTFHISILFDYSVGNIDDFDRICFLLEINNEQILSTCIYDLQSINITEYADLSKQYNEVSLYFYIYSKGAAVSINNLRYSIVHTLKEEENPGFNPSKSLFGVDWLFALYGLLVLQLVRGTLNQKKKKRKKTEEIEQEKHEESHYSKKEGIVLYIIMVSVAVAVTFIIIFSLLPFLNEKYWFVITVSTLFGTYVASYTEFIDLRRFTIEGIRVKMKKTISENSSIKEFVKKIYHLIVPSVNKIRRSVIIVVVFICALLNIRFLLTLAREIELVLLSPSFKSFFFEDVWSGYYFVFALSALSAIVLFFMLQLAWNFTFFEDNLKRIRVLGITILFLILPSWLFIIISIISSIGNLSVLGTLAFPLLFCLNISLCTSLGKVVAQENREFYRVFFKKGRIWTKKKEQDLALSNGIITRSDWIEKMDKIQERKLISMIIWKLSPNIQYHISKLAEFMKLSIDITQVLLIEILNVQPNLGVYYRDEQIFIKNPDEKINGTKIEDNRNRLSSDVTKYDSINVNVSMDINGQENVTFKEFSSYSVLDEQTMSPLFTKRLLSKLKISPETTLEDYLESMKNHISSFGFGNEMLDSVYSRNIRYILENFLTNPLTPNQKELFTFLQTFLSGSIEEDVFSKNSLKYIKRLLAEENILSGYGSTIPTNNGIDSIILNVNSDSLVTFIGFGEWKYRYNLKNPYHSLDLSNQMTNQLEEFLKTEKQIGPYCLENGKLKRLENTGFSFYSTFNRGNDLILKMRYWDVSILDLVKIRGEIAKKDNKTLLTHPMENYGFFKRLKEAILELAYLEAFCENGIVFDEDGNLITSHEFLFVDYKQKEKKMLLESADFSLSTIKNNDSNGDFFTLNIVQKNDFKSCFPILNLDRYKIYLEENMSQGITLKNNNIYVNSSYFQLNYQNLVAEIKTRFINDVRDYKLLYRWKNIIHQEGKIRSDLIFITSNAKPSDDNTGWENFTSLNYPSKNMCLFGADTVYSFALKPENSGSIVFWKNKWYLELDAFLGQGLVKTDFLRDEHKIFQDLFAGYHKIKMNYTSTPPYFRGIGPLYPEKFFVLGADLEEDFVTELLKNYENELPTIRAPYNFNLLEEWVNILENHEIDVSSNSKGREIINKISSNYLSLSSFVKNDEAEFFVVIIQNGINEKKLLREFKSKIPFRLNNTIQISKDKANLFPGIRFLTHNSKEPQVAFTTHITDKNTLSCIKEELLKCSYILDSGKNLIEKQFENWSISLQQKKSTDIYLTSIQAVWLFMQAIKHEIVLVKIAFYQFLEEFEKIKSMSKEESEHIWPYSEPLTLEAFSKNYSFGIINKKTWYNSKSRVVYEILSLDHYDYLSRIYERLVLMFLWSEEFHWLKPIYNLIDELKEIITTLQWRNGKRTCS